MKTMISVKRITSIAFLFALTIILVLIENMIPAIPMLPPGVKLGLSNIVIMFAILYMGKLDALLILLLKIMFVFITRGPIAFVMSAFGGAFSFLVLIMILSLKKAKVSYIILSVCASIAHNLGQLLAALLILYNVAVLYYAPILLLSGVAMGIVTGILLKVLMPVMSRVARK